jgi:hypothetical protein
VVGTELAVEPANTDDASAARQKSQPGRIFELRRAAGGAAQLHVLFDGKLYQIDARRSRLNCAAPNIRVEKRLDQSLAVRMENGISRGRMRRSEKTESRTGCKAGKEASCLPAGRRMIKTFQLLKAPKIRQAMGRATEITSRGKIVEFAGELGPSRHFRQICIHRDPALIIVFDEFRPANP